MSGASKTRRIDGLIEAIDEAKAELEERERALEQREEALKKALEGVDHEKRLMAGRKPSDVLQLNIGGTKCTVSRNTLCLYEPSLLAARFSGRWDDSVEKDTDGCFFIDQPQELFLPLINFLRAKAIETPQSLVHTPIVEEKLDQDFRRVVEYYGMTPFAYQQQFALHRGLAEHASLAIGIEPSVSTDAWSTFVLNPRGHARKVVSFTVVLESVERPQIGWAHPYGNFGEKLQAGDFKGVGEEGGSVSLDGLRGGLCVDGVVKAPVAGLNLQGGSVVSCDRTSGKVWRWLIDGQEVAAVDLITITAGRSGEYSYLVCNGMPAISGKGQWRVTQYAYEA